MILSASIVTGLAVGESQHHSYQHHRFIPPSLTALAVTIVVVIVLVVVRRKNNKLNPPPDGYFPKSNLYDDSLVNGRNVPKRYNINYDGDQLTRSNPVFREMEMVEVDNPQFKERELVASTPLGTVEEEDQEEQEDAINNTVDESNNLV